ncbi:hypothetical protein K1719_006209 [Acacia pycnantha]|nr:hypothetical protein K1719_006209 [Acacia pycnantha]
MMRAMEQMPLMESIVYKVFRIEPLVPSQYGKAKRDLVIESHEKRFKVKEGQRCLGTSHSQQRIRRYSESGRVFQRSICGRGFLVVELFLRYDSFEIQVGASPLGSSVTLTSLKTASF